MISQFHTSQTPNVQILWQKFTKTKTRWNEDLAKGCGLPLVDSSDLWCKTAAARLTIFHAGEWCRPEILCQCWWRRFPTCWRCCTLRKCNQICTCRTGKGCVLCFVVFCCVFLQWWKIWKRESRCFLGFKGVFEVPQSCPGNWVLEKWDADWSRMLAVLLHI